MGRRPPGFVKEFKEVEEVKENAEIWQHGYAPVSQWGDSENHTGRTRGKEAASRKIWI